MAVRRSQNWINQQRVDVPHLRSIESAVRNDFDELIGSFAIGESNSFVIRGFTISMSGAVGSSANSLQMIVENSSIFHGASNEAGTFFQVPDGEPNQVLSSTTNDRINGAFTPNALNYVGLEFTRVVDNTTIAQVFLWNPTTDSEISKTVPLTEIFDYEIVITSSIWASNILPISIVETDSSNNVIRIEDDRPMLFRLGTGGSSTPDPFHVYPWTDGRSENPFSSTSAVSPFEGGDKQLLHMKDWADAVMSVVKEIKGTTYWYSDNSIGGSLIGLRGDLAHTQMTGSGILSHSATIPGQMNWSTDISFKFVGSRFKFDLLANVATTDITLGDDQVAYLNLVRNVDISPLLVWTNSSAIVTSVGAVSWTDDVLANDFIKIKIEDVTRYFQISSVDSASQVTLTEVFDGTSTGSSGIDSQFAYGFYQTDASPSTDRHIQVGDRKDVPFNERTYWIFLRSDNGASPARVYIRGSSGGEIEQGEDREISDNQTLDILTYTGSLSETDETPDYTNSIVASFAETTVITFPAASALSTGQYFELNSALDIKEFYVWANINAGGGNPTPAGRVSIEVPILNTDTAVQVAAKFNTLIDGVGEFNSTDNFDGTITVQNSQVGIATDAANVDMGAGFSVSVTQQGIGSFNQTIIDDENLTKSIKRLDEAFQALLILVNEDPYEENLEVVSGAPADDNEVSGPVTAGNNITIPLNSRNLDVQETYIVGEADIDVFLNGVRLCSVDDYTEVGVSGDPSILISFAEDLQVGDRLKFKKKTASGGATAGGTASGVNLGSVQDADVFKQTVGSQLQFRRLAAGANITIIQDGEKVTVSGSAGVAPSTIRTVVGANDSLSSVDDILLVANSGVDATITLPDATTVQGKVYDVKKIDAGNTMFLKSVGGQLLDGVDIDATPHSITIQNETITVASNGANWFIL